MKCRFLVPLCVFSLFVSPVLAAELGKVELKPKQILVEATDFSGPVFPERVQARLDGSPLPSPELKLKAGSVMVGVDRSVACELSGMGQPLAKHLSSVLVGFHPSATATYFVYDRKGITLMFRDRPAKNIRGAGFHCGRSGSLSLGSLVQSLAKRGWKSDTLLLYVAGHIRIGAKQLNQLSNLAKEIAIVAYVPAGTPPSGLPNNISFFRLNPGQDPSQGFRALVPEVLGLTSAKAKTTIPLLEELEGGAHTLELDFMGAGQRLAALATTVDTKVTPSAPTPPKPPFPLWAWILIGTAGINAMLGLYGLYRTPKCRKCKRPILRSQKACLFCLEPKMGIVITKAGSTSQVTLANRTLAVGTEHGVQLRIPTATEPIRFEIQKQGQVYRLRPRIGEIQLNGHTVQSPRFLRTGDCVSVGEWTCQLVVKKAS